MPYPLISNRPPFVSNLEVMEEVMMVLAVLSGKDPMAIIVHHYEGFVS